MERLFEISELNLPLGAGREKYKRCALSAFASVAQLVEQQTLNLFVTGSTPVRGTFSIKHLRLFPTAPIPAVVANVVPGVFLSPLAGARF